MKFGIVSTSQCIWDKLVIPYMRKGAMTKIMTQAGKLNTLDVPVCNSKFWLLVLEVLDHTPSQVGNAWRVFNVGNT